MTARIVRLPRLEPGSPAWEEQRAEAIGGSEIAVVMKVSPFAEAFGLWHRKKKLAPPVMENEAMRWGKLLEAPIAQRFAEDHPEFKVRRTGTFTPVGRPYQLVSADRDIQGSGPVRVPLEIKKSYDDIGWGKHGSEDIPIYYRHQCIWQMDVFGADHCYLACLIGGADYREYRIGFDADEARILVDEAAAFVGTLRRNERPPLGDGDDTYQVLRNLHPDIDGTDMQISEDLARRFRNAMAGKETADDELQYAKNELLDVMGNARNAVFPRVVNGELEYTKVAQRQPNGTDPATGLPRLTKLVPARKLTELLTFPIQAVNTQKADAA